MVRSSVVADTSKPLQTRKNFHQSAKEVTTAPGRCRVHAESGVCQLRAISCEHIGRRIRAIIGYACPSTKRKLHTGSRIIVRLLEWRDNQLAIQIFCQHKGSVFSLMQHIRRGPILSLRKVTATEPELVFVR
ncbi:hypothetical protein NPIL_321241 [Nephila pilipes]|uniref:Uncharacterized protein n=1 Tax=Nephila pilipes TaxID=299642 RepID=A0A8X6TEH5_NEPPI|nr:hypothetical protein NPIL_321241 [Nephila pilipes]